MCSVLTQPTTITRLFLLLIHDSYLLVVSVVSGCYWFLIFAVCTAYCSVKVRWKRWLVSSPWRKEVWLRSAHFLLFGPFGFPFVEYSTCCDSLTSITMLKGCTTPTDHIPCDQWVNFWCLTLLFNSCKSVSYLITGLIVRIIVRIPNY